MTPAELDSLPPGTMVLYPPGNYYIKISFDGLYFSCLHYSTWNPEVRYCKFAAGVWTTGMVVVELDNE